MTEKRFESTLGITAVWFVVITDFNAAARTLTIQADFKPGSRFAVRGTAGERPVHDTASKHYRQLIFFQRECFLEARVPRVKLPYGAVRQIEPPSAGKLSGFTLLFEALVLILCQQMPFVAAARLSGESRYGVQAHDSVCRRSRQPASHRAAPRPFLQGRALPATQGSLPPFARSRDRLRRLDREDDYRADGPCLGLQEQLHAILERKQIAAFGGMLSHLRKCVKRPKIEQMKEAAASVRKHLEGIVARAQTRQTNGFLEALNGLFQTTRRRARGFVRMSTIRTVIFLIAGKLNFRLINAHTAKPIRSSTEPLVVMQ